ncbi:unnamed protein product [Lathyrus oleraceus]|uniref:uncharacterized protein LOC127093093 n=1 Tax=Pisum sativum TaxID=3888 RepID=UPI001FC58AA6|nr:uncharacterized protein LOC127093093 [Pisum sativum]
MASKNTSSPLSKSNMKTHAHNLSLSTTATNNYGSHAAGIKKAMKILEIQFGNSHTSSTSSTNNNVVDVINNNNMMMTMNNTSYHSDLITGSSKSHIMSSQTIDSSVIGDGYDVHVGTDHSKINNIKNKKNIDDGRTHSLSCKKYGPYICPKCNQVFVTSQKFASHASSHYRFESEEERKKRYMSRIRKRPNLQIHKLNDGTTTLVPVSSSTVHPHVTSVNDNAHNQIASPPPIGVKIKFESPDN